jgi:DNA-directed RNA polymerase specialized sigma24 family protein
MKPTLNYSSTGESVSKMFSFDLQSELFEACKKSDPTAHLQFYKSYYKTLCGISLTILNDAIEADKIIQDSFLIAFEKIGFFANEGSFITWLITFVKNRSNDSLRNNSELSKTDAECIKFSPDKVKIFYLLNIQ